MQFNAMNFIDNLKYMGAGMLGIFIVMGVIIAVIVGLGKLFSRRVARSKNQNSGES